MTNAKRIAAAVLAVMMILMLAACGKNVDPRAPDTQTFVASWDEWRNDEEAVLIDDENFKLTIVGRDVADIGSRESGLPLNDWIIPDTYIRFKLENKSDMDLNFSFMHMSIDGYQVKREESRYLKAHESIDDDFFTIYAGDLQRMQMDPAMIGTFTFRLAVMGEDMQPWFVQVFDDLEYHFAKPESERGKANIDIWKHGYRANADRSLYSVASETLVDNEFVCVKPICVYTEEWADGNSLVIEYAVENKTDSYLYFTANMTDFIGTLDTDQVKMAVDVTEADLDSLDMWLAPGTRSVDIVHIPLSFVEDCALTRVEKVTMSMDCKTYEYFEGEFENYIEDCFLGEEATIEIS